MGLLSIQYLSYSRTLYFQSVDLYHVNTPTHGMPYEAVGWSIVFTDEQGGLVKIDTDQILFLNTEDLDNGKHYRILFICLTNKEPITDGNFNVRYFSDDEVIISIGFVGILDFLTFSFYSDILPLLLIFEILFVIYFIVRKIIPLVTKHVSKKQPYIPLQEALSMFYILIDEIQ